MAPTTRAKGYRIAKPRNDEARKDEVISSLQNRIREYEADLEHERNQNSLLQNRILGYEAELEYERNQNSSLRNRICRCEANLQDEKVRNQLFVQALAKEHGDIFGPVFAELLSRDQTASRYHDMMLSLFGSFNHGEFPQTPSANSIRPSWEELSNEMKRCCITIDKPCPRFSSVDLSQPMWSGLEMLFGTKGQLDKEELEHNFHDCVKTIKPRCLVRCLAGFVLMRLVFESTFPDLIGGNVREREALYTLIAMQDGPTAVHRANYAASKLLISEPYFTDTTIPKQAQHWAGQLCETLEPFSIVQGTDADRNRTIIELAICIAISLKITLELAPLSVRYVLRYFKTGSSVSSNYMAAENDNGVSIDTTDKEFKIRLCLSPALLQVPVQVPTLADGPEAISSLFVFSKKFSITACEEEDMKGVIVVSKAIVLVDATEND